MTHKKLYPAVRPPRVGVYMCEKGSGFDRERRYVGIWRAAQLNLCGWRVYCGSGSGWRLWAKPYAMCDTST